MAPIRVLIVLLAAVSVPGSQALAGPPVRAPRDSALVVHGVIRPATGGVGSVATPEPRVVPDPGDRPMWLPGDWCWTGSESV
jgi:hypothetical protein